MDFLGIIGETFARSGFANLSWQQGVMLLISFVLLYCAIVKGFEPLLLLPIAFGMMLANLPDTGIMKDATEAATLAVQNASAALAADPTIRSLSPHWQKPSPSWQAFIGMIPAYLRSFTAVLSLPSSPASSSWA